VQDVLKRTRGEREGGVENKNTHNTQINLNKEKLGEPKSTSNRANPVQCYSTHQEKCTYPAADIERDSPCTAANKSGKRNYGVATISRRLKTIGLFCRISFVL